MAQVRYSCIPPASFFFAHSDFVTYRVKLWGIFNVVAQSFGLTIHDVNVKSCAITTGTWTKKMDLIGLEKFDEKSVYLYASLRADKTPLTESSLGRWY